MLMRVTVSSLFSAAMFVCSASCVADDWPQFRGPNRDLSNAETGLLKEWPAEGPPRVWMFENCGVGYSGPAIVEGQLYILGSRDQQECLICLDVDTGDELFAIPLSAEYENGWGNGPRSTPTVDGDRVYCLTAKGTLACLGAHDGPILWQVEMQDFGGKIPTWGYSESPLVVGDLVLCTPGGEEGAVVALDKATGETRWQSTDAASGAHYSSIIAATIHDQSQFIQLLPKKLVALAPADGRLLWQAEWPGRVAVIPTPIVSDNRVYVTSGYGIGSMMVEVDADNNATVAYQNKVMKNHHGGVILLDGHIYGHADKTGWMCQDLQTGQRVWRERQKLDKGALGYADGMLYLQGEDSGTIVLLRPNTDGWEEHGRFTLDPQTEIRKPKGRIWTHPVVSGGKLYLRDQDLLYCYDVTAK